MTAYIGKPAFAVPPDGEVQTPTWVTAGVEPERLRCPQCSYIVVGLPEARCPECGRYFDWQAVLAAARSGWRLPIETAKGWRRWSFWRKVSLYTTAFVALDWAGPPILEGWTKGGNFPWVLRPDSWFHAGWDDIVRGVAYYWWMVVLVIILWIRLRRKWCLLVILLLMPAITMAPCRVAYEVTDLIW